MGLFDRFRDRLRGKRETTPPPAQEVATDAKARAKPSDVRLERLARFGDEGGPDETEGLALLRELRVTSLEAAALAALAVRVNRLPDSLATAAAKACIDRGEPAAARHFLAHASSPSAHLLAADLAEEDGDAALALSLVERVLARAIDHPGARERHTRLARALGREAPRAALAPAEGTVLSAHVESPYVIRREIARGGAAAVYEAEDRELGRLIALKVYHDAIAGRPQLLHEARIATDLAQPGVVRIYDVDVRGGFLVLPYFEHGSLREWIRERPEEAAKFEWLESLATVLDEVAAQGFAHLDVKPANVLLTEARRAVLSDFGTARRLGEPSPAGSLGFVSPERLAGSAASALDDVYGFGRIVEEVLAAAPDGSIDAHRRESLAALARSCTAAAQSRPQSLRDAIARA